MTAKEKQVEHAPNPNTLGAGVCVRELEYSYTGEKSLFKKLTDNFAAGEVTAITGRSGVGKSTLLYLLSGMLNPTAGEVYVDGIALNSLNDAQKAALRANRFGFVFQEANLDPARSILDNITETCVYRRQSRADYVSKAKQLLESLEVKVEAKQKPGRVSGGQASRIGLARAIIAEPDHVFADEPTGNLDEETAETIISALFAQAERGATVIVVTHDKQLAARCHKTVHLQ